MSLSTVPMRCGRAFLCRSSRGSSRARRSSRHGRDAGSGPRPTSNALAQGDPQWLQAGVNVTPARTGLDTPLQQQFGGPLLLLMTMVGGVLLLACVNIGSLLLARGGRAAARDGGPRLARRRPLPHRPAGADRIAAARRDRAASSASSAARFGATMLMRIMISGTRSPGPAPRLDIPLDAARAGVHGRRHGRGGAPLRARARDRGVRSAPAPALRQSGGAQPRSRRVFGNGLVDRAGGDLAGAPERVAAVDRASAPSA